MEKLNRRDFLKTVTGALIGSTLNIPGSEGAEISEFPTKEAIANAIDTILAGSEATTTQMFKDEKGIIACTIEFVLKGGEVATLEYMRKGRHEVMKGSNSLRTNMYVTYFADGMPVSGTNIAEYAAGQWHIDSEVLD